MRRANERMARGHMICKAAIQLVLPMLLSVLPLTHTQSPPRFTRTPTDQTGVQGGVASFMCQATGDPQPRISWSRNGKKVTNQRFETIEFEDGSGSVLRVQPLRTPRDEAIYECVASNDAGEISASTRLTVLREDQLPPGFPSIDMGPQLKVVERSRTATMLCAASGTPDPEITWFKDFLPIDTQTHGRIKQLRSGALQIDRSEETDQGKYECVAMNSEGTRYSTPANLYVRVRRIPPRFSVPPMDYEVMPGGGVNITCQAVGVPMPYVKWMLGTEDLTPEDDMPIGKNVLELTDVRQSANYTCVAMSTLGVIETVAQITVKALPSPPGAPVVMERSATSITLMWDSGNPLPVSYYIIQHRPASSSDPFKEIDAVATTRYSVGGLSPYSHYHFRVIAVNSIGRGPPSPTIEARTAEQAPSSAPRRVRGRMLSVSTAMVQWEEPEEANGQVVGYRVYYTSDSSLHVNQWEKEMVRGANFLTIQNLTPNKTYFIRVLAFTAVGDVPSQPTELKAEVKSETSVLLTWLPPSHSGTDAIIGYELIYRLGDQPEQKIVFEPSSSYVLKNLKSFSTYSFQLAARSKHGVGAFTSELSVQTPQTLRKHAAETENSDSTLENFQSGHFVFLMACLFISYGDGHKLEVDGRLGLQRITELKPQSIYTFLLSNKADGSEGLQHRADAMTAPNLLLRKPQLMEKSSSESTATLQLPSVHTHVPVRGFYIIVISLKRQRGGNFQNPWSDPDEMNLDEILKMINGTSRSVRLRRQAEPKPYISAYFPNLPSEFRLGDGRVYGVFLNRLLLNGQEYVCFVLAILELGQNTIYSTSPFSDPVAFSDMEPQPIVDEEEGLLWVVGPVLAVIFIISIVILILLFKRKRAELEGRKCSFPSSGKAMSSQHPSDPVELRRINFPTPGMTSHPPVPISELPSYIERKKASEGLRFSQEYESIDPGQQFSWEHSNLDINKPKNRYANVIAYDHTRVVLSNSDGQPGGDYINANFIDGYRRQGAYIATQGPMPDTISDFWRMSGSSEKREVRQFQFTAWPDHGVPEHPTPFLAFLRRVKACNPPDAGPIVVHCRCTHTHTHTHTHYKTLAGVGRTGCFVVIDAMLERVKQEKTVDVYGHVTLMRSQRNYMVQTEEQYVFIYDALLEAVMCGNTEVPARNLYAYIQRLTQAEPPDNISAMEHEFKRLANARAHNSRFVSANLPCNKFKNRLVNIMPYESTRVGLQPIRGVEGSDYVNASFIDGYRQQRAYIATQGPLAETAEDYWRMLWEHNSTIVEKCHQYWPSERSARYQYFVVDPMAEYNMPQYILREFKGVPKSGEGFIDFIGQVHKTKEQFGQDGPITVHCSAGVGRTGVFITLSIVLERMRYEGVVDIFQTVKMLRTQRPAMVQTEEQYQFCYRAALEYLGSFDHYAT
ncbi:protein tyrosine phosphatase, receptor type, D isoform X17 [Silurus asotus]|uniref:protein-tyrosine-phosphatase n=1 Tax=Silurus asotus TaxID=30991 RepID=A0AAD5B3S3_SILAS|nr:protein tyrosine phosphatase, receptor type, D isoform X17 [Silurus asotus]